MVPSVAKKSAYVCATLYLCVLCATSHAGEVNPNNPPNYNWAKAKRNFVEIQNAFETNTFKSKNQIVADMQEPDRKKKKVYRPKLHGFYKARAYHDITRNNSKEYVSEIRQQVRVELSQRISGKFKYLVSLDARYDLAGNSKLEFDEDEKRAWLWESYLNYKSGNLNVRLGKQVIRWGKGDQINPTDNFTPEDFTEFLSIDERAERKLPAWMANIDYSFSPYRLELIWLPFFVPSRLPETGSDWEPFLYKGYRNVSNVKEPERPKRNLASQVVALKLARNTEDYDLSASYAYHYDEIPSLYLNPATLETAQLYPRQHTFGADFETLIGKIGVRGEFAYTLGDVFLSYGAMYPDTTIEKDSFNGVVGIDYTYSNDIYLNLQYALQYIPDHESNMVPRRYEDSIICKVSRQFLNDTLTFEAWGRLFLYELDLYYTLKGEYDITDSLKVALGYDAYYGEPGALLGQYANNRQFFGKLKLSF